VCYCGRPVLCELRVTGAFLACLTQQCCVAVCCAVCCGVAYPGILFGVVQQIQLRTEDRENGDLGAVAP
jgi:hypothetical protein